MRFRPLAICGLASLSLLAVAGAAAVSPGKVDFARDIRPLLAERCWNCHGSGDQKSGLRLDSRAAALKGGRSGPAFAPGDPVGSELLRRISSHDPKTVMPPGRPLEPVQIALFREWIQTGAEWPEGATQAAGPHWSFIPPKRPGLPAVKNRAWVKNEIDLFILARLEEKGLRPSPPADRRTLLRRVTLDLIGLPPTPEEIAAFLADRSPNAYEKVVRHLLASPHYGERWAQHWLDVVRFGETNGFELDQDRPQAWRYRDYVVKALNEDRPYDRFLREQVAGDLMDPKDFELRVATGFLRAGPQHVVGGNTDEAVNRQEWLTEAVAGIGNGVLGLTIGCARCHDHKFDPIPQADYYRLQAFFAGTENAEVDFSTPEEKTAFEAANAALRAREKPIQDQIAAIEAPAKLKVRAQKLPTLDPRYREAVETEPGKRNPDQKRMAGQAEVMLKAEWTEILAALSPEDRERRANLRKQIHAIELGAPQPPRAAPSVGEKAPPPAMHVLVRGDVHNPGAVVQAGVPAVLDRDQSGIYPDGASRSRLADWLTHPDHPLTGRVMMNRLWQHHFGRGIVATPNDFGRNGARPTHPELLDWLAVDFAGGEKGKNEEDALILHGARYPGAAWSLKRMHYLMVTSATYRQSSALPNAQHPTPKADPDNHLLWRMNRTRLDAEALRDSILASAGTLNPETGGPPVRVPIEKEVYDQIFSESEPDNLWPVTPDPRQHNRRSLYLLRKRNVRLPMLAVFDQPDMMSSCAARLESVHALQALTLMNSDFMLAQSRALARRVLVESGGDETKALNRLYLLTLARLPRPEEVSAAESFLDVQRISIMRTMAGGHPVYKLELPTIQRPLTVAAAAAWCDLCLATLNLNEMVYVN